MAKLLLSFKRQNLRRSTRWLFPSRQKMRFEWLALLAFKRLALPGDQAWATVEEIARLPSWVGKSRHHITTNIGRYLQELERNRLNLVTAESRWAGPYRFTADALSIAFDIPTAEVKKRLRLRAVRSATDSNELLRFTFSYARAQWLVGQGRLIARGSTRLVDTAYQRLLTLAGSKSYSPQLRLVARLGAVQVLFRIGRYRVAREILMENMGLLRRVRDRALKAHYYLALAWAYQRGASGPKSDRMVEKMIGNATAFAEDSGDRTALGLAAHRIGGYLTKKGQHTEAVNHLLRALEAHLITGNYEMVQVSCGNIGSVIHRLGPAHYAEARCWILLGTTIARWMKLGRDDAHGEMVLGKIYTEQGRRGPAFWLLKRAQRIAEDSGNQVNLGDVRMVWAFWYQRFGTRVDERDTLVEALTLFRSLSDFDWKQKERYIKEQFRGVWPEVLKDLELIAK